MELKAAEGSGAGRLGGPGLASRAETLVERRRTCAFDILEVSLRCEAAPEGAGPSQRRLGLSPGSLPARRLCPRLGQAWVLGRPVRG